MKITVLFPALLLMVIAANAADLVIEKKPRAKNLVIFVINGVRYNDAFGDKNHLYIDNIWNKIRPLGTICTKLYNTELTLPIPAQMSLLTGVWHVLENPLNDSLQPVFPTLFEYWNRAYKKTDNTCYFASNLAAFKSMSCSNHAEYGAMYAPVFDYEKKSDRINAVYDKVMPYIQEKKPSFIYLSLGSIGGIGSVSGMHPVECGPEGTICAPDLLNEYYESIIMMDAIIYDLWDRIQQEETYKDNTVFLIVSVHGRHTNEFHSFGDNCDGCRHLFLLAIGPGIKKGFVSNKKRTLIDICRTTGMMFGLPTPYAKGSIMKELFE